MEKEIKKRLEKVISSMSSENIDTLLVMGHENRRYLSGFTAEDTQLNEISGALIITDKKLILATDPRFEIQAQNESFGYELYIYKKGLFKNLPDILDLLKTKRLGFESSRVSFYNYDQIKKYIDLKKQNITLIAADSIFENLRIIKSEQEIKYIKQSLSIAEEAFKKLLQYIKPGITEKQAAWELEKNIREAGASLSFPVICACGPNAALPHAVPSDKELKKGEPILFDWGARLDGYCSDISRTIIFGRPDNTFKKVFNTVLNAKRLSIEAVKEGAISKEIDKIARCYIEENGFKDKFGHGLGHGTGLAIHEPPSINPFRDTQIKDKMVFTIEPGIYIKGWGGVRLENQVAVIDGKAQVLNLLPSVINCENIT